MSEPPDPTTQQLTAMINELRATNSELKEANTHLAKTSYNVGCIGMMIIVMMLMSLISGVIMAFAT